MKTIDTQQVGVNAVSWEPAKGVETLDPKRLVTAGCDNTIKVWTFDEGKQVCCSLAWSMRASLVRLQRQDWFFVMRLASESDLLCIDVLTVLCVDRPCWC